jgi:hypothetical protein
MHPVQAAVVVMLQVMLLLLGIVPLMMLLCYLAMSPADWK